jgi:hypothetical protein
MSEINTPKEEVASSSKKYLRGMFLQGLVATAIMGLFFGLLFWRDNHAIVQQINLAPIMKLACSASGVIGPKHYPADVCLVCCSDDRFTPLVNEFIRLHKYGHVDWIRVPGGAKDLTGEYLSKKLLKLIELHPTKEVAIMVHVECGAYNGEKNENVYAEDLKRIRHETEMLLKNNGYSHPVAAYLAKLDNKLYEVK